jgi:peptidoglycan-associated lipoprotein
LKIKSLLKYLTLVTITVGISACSTQRRLKKADQRYEVGEYSKASTMYRRVVRGVKEKPKRAEVNYKMGECYRKTNNISKASSSYRKAIKYKFTEPIVYLSYAEVLYEQNKIGDAKKNYLLYLASDSSNTQAQNGILACDSLSKWNLKTRYSANLAKQFDSRRCSSFSPALAGTAEDVVYFSTNREGVTGGNNMSAITGLRNNDIYVMSKNLSNKWKEGEAVENINTEYDEGTPSFTADGKTMYFTRAVSDKGESAGASIFVSKRSGAEWGAPEQLVIVTDSLADTLTFAHPAISGTGLQLYFASDLPNGYGGIDIWMVKQEGAAWSIPLNLGPDVNTSGDEMFPYLRNDSTLYFSSNGLPGFGGLDIYKATRELDTEWKIKNMGTPINSKSDDFGITFSQEDERGYFSTNRKDRKGYDHIYSFVLPVLEFKFEGSIIDDKSKEPLVSAIIKLIGNDGTNRKITSKKDGSFSYPLNKEVEYVFLATARGYLNKSGEMATLNASKSIIHTKNFELTSIRQPIRLNNIFFDFASAALTEASFASLDTLVKTLADNPNITIEISAHSDAIGEEDVNIKMSQRRAQSVVNYLIKNKVAVDRLKAQGYGETQPVVVDEFLAEQYKFLKEGDILNEEFVQKLNPKNQEIAYSINRRTVFKVMSTTYKPKR